MCASRSGCRCPYLNFLCKKIGRMLRNHTERDREREKKEREERDLCSSLSACVCFTQVIQT
jgi:hypothetical protein